MDPYKCELCDFSSRLQSNYFRHLTTNKHINNEDKYSEATINDLEKGQKTDKKGHFFKKKGQTNSAVRKTSENNKNELY